jgi:hypothetical protein
MFQKHTEPMLVHELTIRSSVHLMIADKNNPRPVGWGTGVPVHYKDKFYLISVAHVNDWSNLTTFVETNMPSTPEGTPIQGLGGFYYFSAFDFKGSTEQQFIEAIEMPTKHEYIDITFCEIKLPITLLQPEIDFGLFKVESGQKVIIDLEEHMGLPSKENEYSFFGKTRHKYLDDGIRLETTPTYKHSLKFVTSVGNFYIFKAPELIKDLADYEGCSGAPIFDNEGKIVGIACSVKQNSLLIYGFSIQECKKLLDYALETGTL